MAQGKSKDEKAEQLSEDDEQPRDRLIACRDRVLLLLGFAGTMGRRELVGLDVADVIETDGLLS